jgi:hypothetical protein
MVIHVFLIIENTPSWAFYIQNSAPNNKTTFPPARISTKSVSKFVETYSLDILNSNRFRRNQPFAQEIGILTSKFPLMSSLEVMSLKKLHQKKLKLLFLNFFILLQKLQIIK